MSKSFQTHSRFRRDTFVRSISAHVFGLFLLCSLPALAQDTKVVSGNAGWSSDWQQIPGPACLSVR